MADRYEVSSVWVRVMPTVEGIGQEITKQVNQGVDGANIDTNLQKKIGGAFKGIKIPDVSGALFSGVGKTVGVLQRTLTSAVTGTGKLFGDSLSVGARAAGATLAASVAAVGTQVIGGGLNRALGINQATAGLKAMGFEGAQFNKIMEAAGNAVDGTAYSMDQSVLAARNFIAAGVPEEKLQGYLQNVGKLADMGTRSYGDISTMLQSMASTGIIQGGDMLQLAQAGIPIFTALADTLGVSVEEVKKMGSEGKISFDDLNRAITNVDWDAALYAATDVRSAWGNVRAQLSKVGANLWTPVIEKLPSILGDLRSFISIFGKTFDFNPIQVKISASMEKIGAIFNRFKDAEGVLDPKKVKEYVNSVIGDFKNLGGKLEAYKGPIIGALAGMSGSLLSSLPLVGPVFAGLTPIVGVFGGSLVQAYKNSDRLKEAVSGLGGIWTKVKDKLFSSEDGKKFDGGKFFTDMGDNLAKGINFVTDFGGKLIDAVSKRLPEIKEAVAGMMKAVSDAFKSATGDGAGLNADAVAGIFTQVVDIFTTYVPIAVNAILTAGSIIGKVISSDQFKGFIGFLGDLFGAIVQNEPLLIAGIAAAGAIFLGAKLVPLFSAISGAALLIAKIIPGLRGVASATETAGDIAPRVTRGAAGIGASLAGFGKLLLTMGEVAVVVGLIIAAMAGIGYLMEKTGFQNYVNTFITELLKTVNLVAEGFTTVINTFLPTVEAVLNIFTDIWLKIITGLIKAVVDPLNEYIKAVGGVIVAIIDSGSGLVNAFSGLAIAGSVFLASLGGLLTNLAVNGVAAGAGAWAAAGGIAALMAAVAGGSLLNTGASFVDGLVGKFSGNDGGSQLEQLNELISGVLQMAGIADALPAIFQASLAEAQSFGINLPGVIAAAILQNSPVMSSALATALRTTLSDQQSMLDASPLTVRLKVDDSELKKLEGRSYSTGGGNGSGGSVSTKNYSMTTSDASVIRTLLKDGRGR